MDHDLALGLAAAPPQLCAPVRPDGIHALRQAMEQRAPTRADLRRMGVEVEDLTVSTGGGPTIDLTVLRPPSVGGPVPGVYFVHGGGMIAGTRLARADSLAECVLELEVVAVSVEYRLAPEHPSPAAAEDCYAGLCWTSENAARLGIDPDRLAVHGVSAGGGLVAGVALMARDRRGPAISTMVLQSPMLDDRDSTPSSHELNGDAPWDRTSNRTAWQAVLGGAAGGPDVSAYAAPARAVDLRGLPSTYLEVGQVETFRDETITLAARLSGDGVPVEFHLWPGAWHGFDHAVPEAPVSRMARATRTAFLRRALHIG